MNQLLRKGYNLYPDLLFMRFFYIYVRFYPGRQSEPYDAHSDTYSRDTSIYDRSRDTNRERTESRDHIRSQSRDHSFDIKLERVTDTKPIVKLERRNSPNRNSFVTTQTRDLSLK